MADPDIRQHDGQTSPDAGPDHPPPSLPAGWTAQWDGSSRKYYFVQISTGVSTWDVPTSPAPHAVLTPQALSPQPTSTQGDYLSAGGGGYAGDRIPTPSSDRGMPSGEVNQDGDRGLGSTAYNLLAGKPGQHGHQSGLGGLAQSLLSSGGSHGGSGGSSSGGAGKIVGQLAGSLLSGKKPTGHSGSGSSGGGHHSGGGLVGSLLGGLGGHHGHHQQNYGYSTSGSNAPYSGQAPPAQYRPPSQQSVGGGAGGGSQHQPSVSQSSNPHPYGSTLQPPGQYGPPPSAPATAHHYPGQPMTYPQDQQHNQPSQQPYHPNQYQYGPGPQYQHQGGFQAYHPGPGPGPLYNNGQYPPASGPVPPHGASYAGAPGSGPYSELSSNQVLHQQPSYPVPGPNQGTGHGAPPLSSPYSTGPPQHPYHALQGPGPGPGPGQGQHGPPPHHQYPPPPANAQYGAEPHGYGQPPPSAPAWK